MLNHQHSIATPRGCQVTTSHAMGSYSRWELLDEVPPVEVEVSGPFTVDDPAHTPAGAESISNGGQYPEGLSPTAFAPLNIACIDGVKNV